VLRGGKSFAKRLMGTLPGAAQPPALGALLQLLIIDPLPCLSACAPIAAARARAVRASLLAALVVGLWIQRRPEPNGGNHLKPSGYLCCRDISKSKVVKT